MQKKWVLNYTEEEDVVNALKDALGIERLLCSLLVNRGVRTYQEAKSFFRPDLEKLHDPFLMKDMEKAVDRIIHAIKAGERVLVYGDYDVDGTTGVSLMYSFLSNFIVSSLEFYIPDRYKEGYGLSEIALDYAKDNRIDLIICIDCGIRENELILKSLSQGVDIIICDHHLPSTELPAAFAVLDPKRNDCQYPYKELSGCGVAFKLVHGIILKLEEGLDRMTSLLDLVAISIAADIVPITGENRILAYHGLNLINSKPRIGIASMLKIAGVSRTLTIRDIQFIIAPRINAAGRIDSGMNAVRLLLAQTKNEADMNGIRLQEYNEKRRGVEKNITEEAVSILDNNRELLNGESIVLFRPGWHKGVIGIVASRLIEKYYRPTILLAESNNIVTGSARSIPGYDIHNAISQCSDLLLKFGGHKYAAGLSMKVENVERFQARFNEFVSSTMSPKLMSPKLKIDHKIELRSITPKLIRILKQFEPFGPGNLKPVFMTQFLERVEEVRIVGESHLKMRIPFKENGIDCFEVIAFNQAGKIGIVREGKPFGICYNLEENEWNGKLRLQFNVHDISLDPQAVKEGFVK